MLSVASLLNPVKPEPRGLPSSSSSSLCISSSTYGNTQLSAPHSSTKKPKMSKDGAVFAKGKVKGEVNFPPFERLDHETIREVQKYQVYPLGRITEYSRHIPYNSEKKSFLEKTGRESFEVFQYIFKVPGDEKEYTVMWDYNIGLVRITPFFKCCKYSKTTPAKMLNMNAGLKEITHSITGGALAAQGYWMPYLCARAVCATFCSHIAPALIPIFGPHFPSMCTPPDDPAHGSNGRWAIPQELVVACTAEANNFRTRYGSEKGGGSTSRSPIERDFSPTISTARTSNTPPSLGRRLRLKRAFEGSGYETDAASESSCGTGDGNMTGCGGAYFHTPSPITPASATSSWRGSNNAAAEANSQMSVGAGIRRQDFGSINPLLSAIPRSTGLELGWRGAVEIAASSLRMGKREREPEEIGNGQEEGYDGEESENVSVVDGDEKRNVSNKGSGSEKGDARFNPSITTFGSSVAEKNAAWMLMKLSVGDGECGSEIYETGEREESNEPRVKRRRATSL